MSAAEGTPMNSMSAIDFPALIEPVARALLGEPRAIADGGAQWRYGTKGSLAVNVAGKFRGSWTDHEAGASGGVLDLIRRERGCDKGGALDWLRDELGVDLPRRGPGRPSKAEYVARLVQEMRPLAGTTAERYLTEARGLAGPFPADFAYLPRLFHKGAGRELEALLAVARDEDGAPVFLHAVYLDGGRKAPVEPAKKTFGRMEGAAVRIPATNPGDGRIVLAEGPEDAFSIAQATGLETWACCGVANVGKASPPAAAAVVVAAQNDPGDKAAVGALRRAVGRLRGRGLRVVVCYPPAEVKDWNDLLREGGPEAVRAALAAEEARAGWRTDLIHTPQGEVSGCLANAILALSQHDDWRGVLGFDEFAHATVMRRPAPWLAGRRDFVPREWIDDDDTRTAEWLQRVGVPVNPNVVPRAVERVARDAPFHPVKEYLTGLTWDGTARAENWLAAYLGADATKYTRAIGSRVLIQAVARVMEPGCKADQTLILEGPQGKRKSSAVAALAGEDWFTDELAEMGGKDAALGVAGRWIVELGELSHLRGARLDRVKQYLTRKVDDFRPPYGRRNVKFPRQCVFIGTVDQDEYLNDDAGNRRFWPVRIGRIDLDKLRRDRDQLWAEAVKLYRDGQCWHLDSDELEALAREEQDARREADPWEETVRAYAEGRGRVSVAEVMTLGLGIDKKDLTKRDKNRVAAILRHMGWIYARDDNVPGKSRPRVFFAPEDGGAPGSTPPDHNGPQPPDGMWSKKTPGASMGCPQDHMDHNFSLPHEGGEKNKCGGEINFDSAPMMLEPRAPDVDMRSNAPKPLNGNGKTRTTCCGPDVVPPIADRCAYCSAPEQPGMPLKKFGDPNKGGSLMHPHCRTVWLREREEAREQEDARR